MKFAKRTDWSFETNQLTRTIDAMKAAGERILDLTVSNPTKCGITYPGLPILSAFDRKANLEYVPVAKGMEAAREAVRAHYARQGIRIDPRNVFLTASTSEAYSFVFRLLANPGDRMLFPRPSYPLFHFLAGINDVELDLYPLVYSERWGVDIGALTGLSAGARGIILVHPNNPTGSCVQGSERDALTRLCRERGMPLIVDEVFLEYPLQNKEIVSFAGHEDCLTFVMGGLSKTLGLPQMKLSWIILNGPADEVKEAAQRLEIIADTFLSANTPAQNALPEWLALFPEIRGGIWGRVTANHDMLREKLKGRTDVRLLDADGGWYAMLHWPAVTDEESFVLGLLKEKKIFVHPGYFFDCDEANGAHLVISLLTPPEILGEATDLMLAGE